MDISQIQVAIAHPDVRVVSLDIFDTLVERPAVFPTDIFFLLNDIASQIAGRRHFDFSSSRPACERRALRLKTRDNQHHQEITFKEIYDQLARTHGLSEEQRQRLSQAEQDLEMRLLAVREPGRALYHAAVTAGKKVICISDMYYGTDFLRQILAQHGYSDVAELYVSSEINKRKDSGQLFEHVLKMEGLQPHQLLHIGDNPLSDFKVPLSLGIPAYHLPSSRDLFRSSPFAKEGLWRHVACLPKADRIVIGYFINRWADRQGNASVLFPQKSDFGYFGVGPLLFSVAQYLLSHREIQSLYPCIHFASRDGYLPQQAYDLLREEFKHTADSRYVHCGRSLYQVADYDGDLQGFLFKRLRSPFAATFTIGNLFDSLTDPSILPPSDPRRNMRVGEDSEAGYRTIREITRQHRSSIEQAIRKKQQLAQMYYRSAMNFTDTRRALIFDCGYSGSISTAIGSLTGMIVDKAYIWEDRRRNRCRDHRNRSRTFLLGHSVGKSPREGFWLAAEELFAPAEPACRGFERNDGRLEPLFDSEETFSTEMKNDLATIQGSALQFVGDLRDALGPYLPFLRITNISPFMAPLLACFDSKTDPGIRHLDNIVFRDPFFGETRHLAEKLEQPHQHHFLRTPFLERSLLISRPLPALETREMAIAMHLHLFHIGQAAHIAKRLALFPLP
jgi:HAD superfamily hydrolase (TIGR01549 family)